MMLLLAISTSVSANRGGFVYRNISLEAVVHENNEWEMTETFDIFFDQPRHGFYRYIPNSFKLKHKVDGKLESFPYRCVIDDISVDGWKFTTEDSNDEFCIIRIGDENREVEGLQRYEISYTFSYPDDRLADMDYLFHTVLGTEFEDPIEHFEFHISFDKPLPDDIEDLLEVYAGEYGKTDGVIEDLSIEVSPTEIRGEASNVEPRHGITLYAELPSDYYENVRTINYTLFYLFLALTVLLAVVIAFFLFTQRTPHVTKVIEFYPPEGISSAEVGTIIDDSADNIDITSLIPWLAGQGYIKIREFKKGRIFKTTDLELTKVKDLPTNAPSYQRRLMKMLFSEGDVVCMKDIGERPSEFEAIKDALSKQFKGPRKLTEMRWPVWLYGLLAIAGTLALGFNSVVTMIDTEMLMGAGLLFGLPMILAVMFRVNSSAGDLIEGTGRRVLYFILTTVLMLACWGVYAFVFINHGAPLGLIPSLAIFVVCHLLTEMSGRFNVSTDYRVQMMGRLLGFKEFIETAEKDRLQQLQADDPQYFYKVLPYAMVFDLSDKWDDLFKDIEVQKPDWYESSTPLMGYALTHNMVHNFYTTASNAISTISHSSDSGSSGGGGFSGGGGGGGGGGSW